MLKFSQAEKDAVTNYYLSQSPNASVNFAQKVYSESVISHTHDVWDLHTSDGRWWIITNPSNLYSQDQFPNMDLALTFHMGLCLRIPRTEKRDNDVATYRLFGNLLSAISDSDDALSQANDAGAYRAIGVRCRENLLSFIHIAQELIEWPKNELQKSNFNGWVDLICDTLLSSSGNRERRRLLKSALKEVWTYVNWLTHSQSGKWVDAEIATTSVSHALGMAINLLMRRIRGVPDACPECDSNNLFPLEAVDPEKPELAIERPKCADCGWLGDIVLVGERTEEEIEQIISSEGENNDACGTLGQPLSELKKPA